MPYRKLFLFAVLVIGLALFATSCKKKGADTVPEEPAQPAVEQPIEEPAEEAPVEVTEGWKEEAPVVEEAPEPTIAELNAMGVLKTVYFEFDKSDLTDETRAVLRANAAWLKENGRYSVVIEGHCDERGTIEYNLALGQRRAQAVRDYLASLGVASSRTRLVSYGEERPADYGHTESAWAKNRRAEFVIE
jgi:peptidoglycan-associated lipoprotein